MTPSERQKMDVMLERFADVMNVRAYSERTAVEYRRHVARFFDWLSTDTEVRSLGEVDAAIITAYEIALATEEHDGHVLSTGTRFQRLAGIKAFFSWLTRETMLLANPALAIEYPKRRQPLPAALLTPKEALVLIESIDTSTPLGLRDRAIIEVLYATGIRNSELRALVLEDFDHDGQTILIRHGKGGKGRVVPTGPLAAAVVREYIDHARPKLHPATDHLFITQRGTSFARYTLAKLVAHAARRAGITKTVRPHKLRHACATHMLARGADVRHIQQLLGHESIQSTQIYTRVEISDLKRVHKRFHPRERRK